MIDFADHFWGDKHNGYNVLYLNMKQGQTSVKELADFIKEAALIEDEYQKHLTKIIKQVSNYGQVGTFSPVWSIIKSLMEKFSQLHVSLLQNLHDVNKEVQKYGDEQQKSHKMVRETESKTMEAVNLMQTTTTCLQKSKENYVARCLEHEKLKKENSPVKEISKSENRVKKAAEEYKQYVDKYGKVRDNYEQRMISSCKNFQEFEVNHLNQMKQLVINYANGLEGSYAQLHQTSLEFRDQMVRLDIDVEILQDFIEKKQTGTERPSIAVFDEIDLTSDVNKPHPQIIPLEDGFGSGSLLDQVLGVAGGIIVPAESSNSIINFDHAGDGLITTGPNGTAKQPMSNGPAPPAAPPQQPPTKGKLSLWLPTNFSRKSKPTSSSKLPTPTPSPSNDPSSTNTETGGFLHKLQKPKKKKETDNKSDLSNEDCKSQSSGGRTQSAMIDEEGFTIRQEEEEHRKASTTKNNESSSDYDSDDETPKRINIQIKKPPEKPISASVDELKDAFKEVNIYAYPNVGSRQKLTKEMSLDDFDPMKSSGWGSASHDPWQTNRPPAELLRPAKTGDDRYNTKLFAGLHWTSSSTSGQFARKVSGEEPWPAEEGGDTVGDLVTSVSRTNMRPRPRSTTPTSQMFDNGWTVNPANNSFDGMSTSRISSMEFSSSPTNGAAGVTSPGRPDATPLAIGLTETAHVLFKGSNSSGCTIKIYGSLTISFPSTFIQTFSNDERLVQPLIIKLNNADKIQSILPNRQVLPNESSFKADTSHEFEFNMHSLITYLKQRHGSAPSSPFFNLHVLQYEVRVEPNLGSVPLILQSYWKCQPSQTDIVVQYNYNPSCPISAPLLNLHFSTQVDGEVTQAQLKPEGSWNSEESRLLWKMTELSRHGESSGSLKARLTVVSGPSTPVQTAVNFQMNDVCLSGADVQVVGNSYRISLLKKKLVAGRYLCEAELR